MEESTIIKQRNEFITSDENSLALVNEPLDNYEYLKGVIKEEVSSFPKSYNSNYALGLTGNNYISFNSPFINKNKNSFDNKFSKKIQSWIGIVTCISEKTFTAELEDLSHSGTNEIGEFDISLLNPNDKFLLEEGAIFYWTVGYNVDRGQVKKFSEIRFQRLIKLSEDDFEYVAANVKILYSNLKEHKIEV